MNVETSPPASGEAETGGVGKGDREETAGHRVEVRHDTGESGCAPQLERPRPAPAQRVHVEDKKPLPFRDGEAALVNLVEALHHVHLVRGASPVRETQLLPPVQVVRHKRRRLVPSVQHDKMPAYLLHLHGIDTRVQLRHGVHLRVDCVQPVERILRAPPRAARQTQRDTRSRATSRKLLSHPHSRFLSFSVSDAKLGKIS